MISYLFYIFFLLSALSSPFIVHNNRFRLLVLFNLFICAQFNVTAFFKIGLTFSFFELSLFLTAISIIITRPEILKKIKINYVDFVFITFLVISLLTILISIFRINLESLRPMGYIMEYPAIRSLMSLNKIFIFVPLLILLRSYLLLYYEKRAINDKFIFYLALSGIFPAIATIIQFTGVGFDLIHNNPSFAETFKIVNYKIERPVGLTNEASFLVFQLFFPFIATYEAKRKRLLSKTTFISLIVLFLVAVVLSLSRTGLVFYLLFILLYQFRNGISLKKMLLMATVLVIGFFLIKDLNISGTNIVERLASSFDVEADLSTIERYGSTEAIYRLTLDKAMFLGVGIYNYGYYVMAYLPSYMDVIHYDKDRTVPSFNFILQLVAEFGLPLFIIFIGLSYYLIKKNNTYFINIYFLFLFFFALTFQILNFAIPFLIILYTPFNYEKDSLYN